MATELIESDRILGTALRDASLNTDIICDIIDERRPATDGEVLLYRSILSGALDPDKLDYLNRDAYFAGVPYGIQDVSYITDHLCLHEGSLAIGFEALGSVQHLLFSKYLMYRNVYWHKTVRSATAMIKRCLFENLNKEPLMKNSCTASMMRVLSAEPNRTSIRESVDACPGKQVLPTGG